MASLITKSGTCSQTAVRWRATKKTKVRAILGKKQKKSKLVTFLNPHYRPLTNFGIEEVTEDPKE